MITRSQSGIVKPIDRLSLNTFLISPIPKNPSNALKDPQWRNAMYDEYNALVKNDTWLLVPRPACVNMIRSIWLFKHKFHADGTLSRYKARLVSNSSSQQLGVDFEETFSPVVKPATIRTVLSPAVSRKWPIHQLDVKNAFLNGDLSETVYMHQPPGFVDGSQVAYHLLYVDDNILTASSTTLLQQLIDSLHCEFDMTDLGALNYFLTISVVRHSTSLFLSQRKYALQLLECAHMVNCNPSRTLVDTESKLVQQICLYMHDPREPHLDALKRILRYFQSTLDLGLHLYASSTTSLVGYTEADWAGCPSTRSAEAEYRGVADVVAETAWLRNLLRGLHSPLSTATLVYCDNVSAVFMSANPVQHQQMKHIEIDIHFVRDMVTAGQEVLAVMFENDNEHDFNLVIDMHTKLNDLGMRIRQRVELILDVEKHGYSAEVFEIVKLLKDLQETDNAKTRSFMKVINETELKILENFSLIVQFLDCSVKRFGDWIQYRNNVPRSLLEGIKVLEGIGIEVSEGIEVLEGIGIEVSEGIMVFEDYISC
ncbi:ribonuclease H-like domain-containing protein [Tanacetum coccineum]|uniref:Ribonuclease H-like domain-containing protein n=1 Tax=Tanacetum coccineum TaxID=301880 RepID=A0ABQ4WH32_9ASTR